mgnify:CR=1 FL=1
MALLVNETKFNSYIAAVNKRHTIAITASIHKDEHDIAYQIKLQGEHVTIARFTPPTEYLIFDTLGLYKLAEQQPQNGSM